ncbi:porin [Thermaurantiacus sp.]|uniref:porin n=1 Tax=Thermaurantiacus sp. TaxID=2820283 RepID=UPI00399F06D3
MPVNTPRTQVRVGVAGYWRFNMRPNEKSNAYRAGDRPNIRIDNTRMVDTGTIPDVDEAHGLNFEAVASTGPLSLQGEHHKVWVDRDGDLLPGPSPDPPGDPDLDGFHIMGSWLITGSTDRCTRAFSTAFDRRKSSGRATASGAPSSSPSGPGMRT